MKKLVLFFASITMMSACSFEQDPLANYPVGQPPEYEKPNLEKQIPKDALQIDAPREVNGRVGVEISFKIEGRVLVENVGHKIVVENLESFPGATFDLVTGEFRWTPQRDLVKGQPSVTVPLTITLVTEKTASFPVVTSESNDVFITVANDYTKPIINWIDTLPDPPLRVGDSYTTGFQAEDLDADDVDDTYFQFGNCESDYKSIAHLIYYDSTQSELDASGKLTGKFTINLNNANDLKTGTYCFSATAYSVFGIKSEPVELLVDVEDELSDLVWSLDTDPEVTVGEKLTVNFSIFDPQGEGIVALDAVDDISEELPGSSLLCQQQRSQWLLNCTAILDATNVKDEYYSSWVKMDVSNSSRHSDQKIVQSIHFRFSVKAAR